MIDTKDICCGILPYEEKILEAVVDHADALAHLGGEVHFQKGHALFYEGHHPLGFYILKSGEVALSRLTIRGERKNLSNPQKRLFGLFHLLTHTPHCAMAVAKIDCKMIFVPKAVVLEFLKKEGL